MKLWQEIRSWIGSIGLAFVLVLIIGIFVFQPFKVSGHSMDPTLHDKERIYVSKISNTLSYLPAYGDIVVIDSRVDRGRTWEDRIAEHPLIALLTGRKEEDIFYVKRLIGKPGDVLELKEQQMYRNGELLKEAYIKEPMMAVSYQKWVVPEGHVFVMGDNRNNSLDSRAIGFIPIDHVLGVKKFP
ncbi:signal peptidase I [Paenibacillus gansuensis]|uniref:Signal peptidase I n=1 Tax=Paenibacillus gansuensis TaxID=306542 RepID=A0ABW5PGE4_9BACL